MRLARYAGFQGQLDRGQHGLLVVSGLAVVVGRTLLRYIALHWLHYLGAAICLVLAVLTAVELALEAGAEELTTEEEQYVITTSHDQLYAVAEALKNAGVTTDGQKFTFIPDTTVPVHEEAVALQILRLCDSLEEDDDVQNVYSNLDISDELLAKLPV